LVNGLARIGGSFARAKQAQSQSKTLYPFLRDGGGATARSEGGVGSDVTPSVNTSLEAEMLFMDKGWAKLRSWLLKRYGRFEFLKILEVQKSGRPHFHILISGIPYISHEDLSEIWQKYGGGYVWIRSVSKDLDAVLYVLKYVNKTILGDNKIYAALLFASNKRMFSMSQNLMSMLNVKRGAKEHGWAFQGTVDKSSVKAFCTEKEIAFEDFVRTTVTIEMLYDYPLLFDVWESE